MPDPSSRGLLGIAPSRYLLARMVAPAAAVAMACLLVFGLLGGWIHVGRMLAPLTRIRDAARLAETGSLSPRIRMKGCRGEFREPFDAFAAKLLAARSPPMEA
ncbi:hypothetical protein [Streptomyces sp. NPDC002221]|uniref:hypothetical protein n=1 Tax=Streptomyces sp. NPDC002221 TaxID=3364639 RepID=UPI0036B6F555